MASAAYRFTAAAYPRPPERRTVRCAKIAAGRTQPAFARPTYETMKDQLLRKLQDEITALDRELKMELPKEIKRARELGDLRENAEYHAAKERQTYVQARISMLQKRVSESAADQPRQDPARQGGLRIDRAPARGHRVDRGLPARDAGRRRRREGAHLHVLADRPGDCRQGSRATQSTW